MESLLLNLAIISAMLLGTIALVTHGANAVAKGVTLLTVITAVGPGAYSAAKAEGLLPQRSSLSSNDAGNNAKLFNTIVQDRLRQTSLYSQYPAYTAKAVAGARTLAH